MQVPPTGNFYLPFSALLRIRILCTFSQTSRNINQLRLLTAVSAMICIFWWKTELVRYWGHNRGDWKFPVISLSESLSPFFLSQMAGTTHKDSGTFQSTSVMWDIHTPLQILVLGTLRPTGQQPVHPGGQGRGAFPILVPSTLSTPWCKPSQAAPMSELMVPSPSISHHRHILRVTWISPDFLFILITKLLGHRLT